MRPTILVTRKIPEPCLEKLSSVFQVDSNQEDRPLNESELQARLSQKDALLCLLTDVISATLLRTSPQLKIISNCAVGFNNIDIETANFLKIPVGITPEVLTETTADLTWALILSVMRRVVEADRFLREGKFHGWELDMLLGHDVYGKTLGIIGMGRIGQAVAKRAFGFGMKILYSNSVSSTTPLPQFFQDPSSPNLAPKKVPLKTLLLDSDIVSLHVPLSKESKHLIGKDELSLMKKSAFLINTSRGPLVDEHALIEALQRKQIAGVGLDVYEDEPRVPESLIQLPQTVLLPHIGSASHETRTRMAQLAVENAIHLIQGKIPFGIANPQVLSSR